MSKGRRAADRRREREGARGKDERRDTHPGPALEATRAGQTRTGIDPALADDPELAFAAALSRKARAEGTGEVTEVAEVTLVREREPTPRKRGGKLTVRAGPDAKRAFVLAKTQTLLGRGAAASLALSDPTVSREHLAVRFSAKDALWTVEDLGSGSGTLLNGELIEGPTEIQHGDLLHVGQSELRFTWHDTLPEAEAPPPPAPREVTRTGLRAALYEKTEVFRRAPGPEPKTAPEVRPRRVLPIGAAMAAVLVLLGTAAIGVYLVRSHSSQDETQIRLQVDALLSDAKRLLAELQLAEARARLETVLALTPGQLEAQSLLRSLEGEEQAVAALEEARAHFAAGRHREARQACRQIADTSRFAVKRDRLKAAISEKERARSMRAVERLLDQEGFEEAEGALEAHLRRWPSDEAAQLLSARLTGRRGTRTVENPAVQAARRAFFAGDLSQARELAEAEAGRGARPAQRYLADLDTFEAALQKGERHLKLMNAKEARPSLERAFGLLERLGGKAAGVMAKQVAKPLANALYLEAMAKQQRGDACGWAEGILRAHELSAADPKVIAQKRAVDSKAKAGLLQARAALVDDVTRAQTLAREHVCFAPATTATGKGLRKLAR